MGRVVFSNAARGDRSTITAYTVEEFGIRQARRLRRRFEVLLNQLASSPDLGRRRPELDPPGHEFRYFSVLRRFVIVYRPVDDGIQVARILHAARDLAAELDRDPGKPE